MRWADEPLVPDAPWQKSGLGEVHPTCGRTGTGMAQKLVRKPSKTQKHKQLSGLRLGRLPGFAALANKYQ